MQSRDAIRAIKERLNITDIVRRYVDLKRNGPRWVAPCPFHQETKPSFSVNEEQGLFYCFGCQASGDIFDFYGRINGLDFRETLEQLAAEAGITLDRGPVDKKRQEEDRQRRSSRQTMLRMYELAAAHFAAALKSPEAEECRAYIQRRGLSPEIVERFGLGWARRDWHSLDLALQRAGYDMRLAAEAGLVGRSDRGSVYDRFRGRLIFPIKNLSNQVIAFGGRIIADEDEAKYINSSDTPIYKKGEHLYGLAQARKGITVKGRALLTEGYMDVLTLHQFGYDNAVGVLGTALTLMVNAYSQNERTNLLKENVQSVSGTISSSLIMQDINSRYSVEKELMCESLYIISNSIDADVFVCDVEGNIILCKERAYSTPYFGEFTTCALHDSYSISSALLQRVYETGTVTGRITVRGQTNYIVGTTIVSDGDVIGYTFAQTQTGVQSLALAVIRIFLLSALACLMLAFICIWHLTKKMVTPLQQMSAAAKQFAIGDFSYRVKVRGCDELADLGIAFNDMADALDKTESSRASFVANVSHELKTPMTSIAGFIDGILDGTIPKEKQNYYLGLVSTEVRRLSRLVVAMLNMSKIESGEFQMKPNNYDISDQIIRILLTFEQKIEKKNIEIIGLEDLQPQYIVADPDMIYQVIYNLFDNAVKFTNEDGFIKVTLEDLGSQIRVSIKNSGAGIKAEELSRVFERFYRVDKSRSKATGGTGLGLAIVKHIALIHGARIKLESQVDVGTTITVTFPTAN